MNRMAVSKNERSFFVLFWVVITLLYFSAQVVFAQDMTAEAVSSPVLDQAKAFIGQLDSAWAMTIGVLVVEVLMRAFKTKNPKSLLYVLSNILKMIAKLTTFLAEAADKVLQRTENN